MKIMSYFGEFDRRPAAYRCRCVVVDITPCRLIDR